MPREIMKYICMRCGKEHRYCDDAVICEKGHDHVDCIGRAYIIYDMDADPGIFVCDDVKGNYLLGYEIYCDGSTYDDASYAADIVKGFTQATPQFIENIFNSEYKAYCEQKREEQTRLKGKIKNYRGE